MRRCCRHVFHAAADADSLPLHDIADTLHTLLLLRHNATLHTLRYFSYFADIFAIHATLAIRFLSSLIILSRHQYTPSSCRLIYATHTLVLLPLADDTPYIHYAFIRCYALRYAAID